MMKRRGLTVIDLFCGAGGMSEGFWQAGFRVLVGNDIAESARETFITAHPSAVFLAESIEKLSAADFLRAAGIKRGELDCLIGGPPCQGFSSLGKREPNDPRNRLWRHYLRCVEGIRPKVFVIENVPPLLRTPEYSELLKIAEHLGYTVKARVLNTADYGVPQTRKRAIVIGSRVGEPSFPSPTNADPIHRSNAAGNLPAWLTVRDAISHLPKKPTGRNWHIGRNPTAKSIQRYRHIRPGGNRWQLPTHLMPDCWKRKVKGGTDIFGRLWWDRPSVTIRTEFYKPEKGRYLHPSEDRPITHREAALLQGFHEHFDFQGSKIQVGVQIGNAVPPPLGRAIAKHVHEVLLAT